MSERAERRLAAILAADVAGYSRLMGADEEGTFASLKAHLHDVIEPKVAEHRGRIVKTTGDGALVEFASVVDAVRCAVEVQQEMTARNDGVAAERRIVLRIGINVGDVILDDGDLYGDGVNVAARLESLAQPGETYVSGAAFDQSKGKVPFCFEDLGAKELKNIVEPVRVYRVAALLGDAPRTSPAQQRPSIAVLAFANMSGGGDQEYFADGIAEDIITALSRFRWLDVIARNSSFTFKGRNVDVRTVGRELGVRYVLEGSVRKSGNRLRITAQLVEAQTGSHLWAEKYDGAFEDVFDLQDQITVGVVGAIEPSVRQAEIERARRKRPESLDAYDLYLRALPHVWTMVRGEADKAIDLLHRALAIDPDYVAARAMASFCILARWRAAPDAFDFVPALDHARKVVASRTDDAEALAFAGFALLTAGRDPEAALATISRALEISPNSPTVLGRSALVEAMTGQCEAAIEHAERSIRLSPFDPMRSSMENAICVALFQIGRFAEAAETARRTIKYNPRFGIGYAMLAVCCVKLGRPGEAKDAARRLIEVEPGFRIEGSGYWGPSRSVITAILRELGLPP